MTSARSGALARARRSNRRRAALEYLLVPVAVLASLALAELLRDYVVEPDLVMVFLLGVALVAFWVRVGPALATAILSVAAYDFFFVAPEYTFAVADARYLITLAVMAGVGVVLSSLTARLRVQTQRAREREERTTALYRLTHELVGTVDEDALVTTAARSIHEAFDRDVELRLTGAPSVPSSIVRAGASRQDDRRVRLPLVGSRSQLGEISVFARDGETDLDRGQSRLLGTFVGQVALALERTRMAAARKQAEMAAETERLRNTLLSSVSHDLRTPLGSVMGSATTLLDREANIEPDVQRELLVSIRDEAERLSRLLNNLLAMTRVEGGALELNASWQVPEDTIGAALRALEHRASARPIEVEVEPDVGLVEYDDLLLELVLSNLVENALKYTPAGSPIELRVSRRGDDVRFEVRDRGPGIPQHERARLFDKFFRGEQALSNTGIAGTGLGLAICKAAIEAHRGRIYVEERADGPGAVFAFTIPAATPQPAALDYLESSEEEAA